MRGSYQIREVFGMTTKDKYPDFPMAIRWHAIKVALLAKGISLSSLSKSSGVTGIASAGNRNYPAAQTEIAKALGVSEGTLFPERYDVVWNDELQAKIESTLPELFDLPVAVPARQLFTDLLEKHSGSPIDLEGLPSEEPARLTWIKAALRNRGFVLISLTSHLGIRRSALDTLGSTRLDNLQHLVARCLGIRPEQIWPERYDGLGRPIPKVRSRAKGPEHREPQVVYRLDLTKGLWLPVRDLVGLPGMATDETFIEHRAHVQGWQMRQRFGVNEIAFGSLPEATKQYLLTPTALGAEESIVRSRRRLSGPVSVEATGKHEAATITVVKVNVVDKAVHLQMGVEGDLAVLNREQVSLLAAALIDASQEIPE
ncbi:hypothetical protein C1890_09585 [Pseudomonas sp. DP16D-R1]|jgi:lambda repressor-like predicted transcriptional regulator|nr:hypothetical protein C1890_09585 [Pseudomonas sp. DP16D-R1]